MKVENDERFDEIRKTYESYFADWKIKFSKELFEFGVAEGGMSQGGWMIEYAIDYDANKNPEMYIAADHRMTNPRRFKIRNNGEMVSLKRIIPFSYPVHEKGGSAELKQNASYVYHRRLSAINYLTGCEYGSSLSHGIKNIFNQGVKGEYRYSSKNDKLHPDFEQPYSYKGREFCSISHCVNFYRNYYSVQELRLNIDENEILESTKDLGISGIKKKDDDIKKDKTIELTKEWLRNRERIIFEATVCIIRQNKDLLENILDKVSCEFIFENSNIFWGTGNQITSLRTGKNILGLIQASACFWLYYGYTKNADLI